MKRILLLCLAALAAILSSCSKFDEAADNFAENIAGPYNLNLADWCGSGLFTGLNLNGDDSSGNDILSELQDYACIENLLYSLGGYVEAPDESGSGRIWLRIPLQDILLDDDHNYTLVGAVAPAIGFKYTINSYGEFKVDPEADYSEVENYLDSPAPEGQRHWGEVRDANISEIIYDNETIVVEMMIAYYDFDLGLAVSGPVRLTYCRL